MKRLLPLAAFACAFALALSARGDQPSAARSEARERFERGLQLHRQGDPAGALAEFAQVQASVPDEYVLFNIGLVYAELNRPAEAIEALQAVLLNPGRLSRQRLQQAASTRDAQAKRIAHLALVTNVPAMIEIDGVERARTPLASPLVIASGMHVISARAPGHASSSREITIAGGAAMTLELLLEPEPPALAHLVVESALPAADVRIDGTSVGRTPLDASVPVAPGPHVVELSRPGYLSARREISLAQGAIGHARIEPTPDPSLPRSRRGRLELKLNESDAFVAVNGHERRLYVEPLDLPPGPHRVRVERAGFQSEERRVVLHAGKQTVLGIELAPTPETRVRQVERARSDRRWAWIATASGASLAVVGTGVAVWSAATLPALERQLRAAQSDIVWMSGSGCDPSLAPRRGPVRRALREKCLGRIEQRRQSVSRRELMQTLGTIGAGAGLVLGAFGVYLLMTESEAGQSDPSTAKSGEIVAQPWIGLTQAGLSVSMSD
jgi:hypothetical protein